MLKCIRTQFRVRRDVKHWVTTPGASGKHFKRQIRRIVSGVAFLRRLVSRDREVLRHLRQTFEQLSAQEVVLVGRCWVKEQAASFATAQGISVIRACDRVTEIQNLVDGHPTAAFVIVSIANHDSHAEALKTAGVDEERIVYGTPRLGGSSCGLPVSSHYEVRETRGAA